MPTLRPGQRPPRRPRRGGCTPRHREENGGCHLSRTHQTRLPDVQRHTSSQNVTSWGHLRSLLQSYPPLSADCLNQSADFISPPRHGEWCSPQSSRAVALPGLVSFPFAPEVLRSIGRLMRGHPPGQAHGRNFHPIFRSIHSPCQLVLLRKQTRTVTTQSANWSKNAFSRCKIWWKQKLVVLLQSQTGSKPDATTKDHSETPPR